MCEDWRGKREKGPRGKKKVKKVGGGEEKEEEECGFAPPSPLKVFPL